MSSSPVNVWLRPEQQELLEEWVRAHGAPQQVAKRCQIVLLANPASLANVVGITTSRQPESEYGSSMNSTFLASKD